MNKKTRFKLTFVKNYITINQHKSEKFEKVLKQRKKISRKEPSEFPLLLYKYFNPITVHRIGGDLVFLDTTCNYDEFIPLTSLWNQFKTIQEITISGDFSVCTKSDSRYFSSNAQMLVERLLTLGDKTCFKLAMMISNFWQAFNALPLANKETNQTPITIPEENDLNECLNKHKNDPVIMYYYRFDEFLGMVNTKISINNVLKNMTFQDDFRIFEESIFVVSKNDYFSYMIDHLQNCFSNSDSLITLYLNTKEGVKKIFAKGMRFTVEKETCVVVVIPKEDQSPEVQKMYEMTVKDENENEKEKEKEMKKSKIAKTHRDWEDLIKLYYDPVEINQSKKRCKYREINQKPNFIG